MEPNMQFFSEESMAAAIDSGQYPYMLQAVLVATTLCKAWRADDETQQDTAGADDNTVDEVLAQNTIFEDLDIVVPCRRKNELRWLCESIYFMHQRHTENIIDREKKEKNQDYSDCITAKLG